MLSFFDWSSTFRAKKPSKREQTAAVAKPTAAMFAPPDSDNGRGEQRHGGHGNGDGGGDGRGGTADAATRRGRCARHSRHRRGSDAQERVVERAAHAPTVLAYYLSLPGAREQFCTTLVPHESLRAAVRLPESDRLHEWISMHCVDFLSVTHLLYSIVYGTCTEASCPVMTVGPHYECLWQSSSGGKKAADQHSHRRHARDRHHQQQQQHHHHHRRAGGRLVRLSAPCYIESLLEWADEQLPTGGAVEMQNQKVAKAILRRLFRVYAHVYHDHLDVIVANDAMPHLTTCFLHFYFFVSEFKLVSHRELEPLKSVVACTTSSVQA